MIIHSAGDPQQQFNIHPSTGVVKVLKQLDFETRASYELTLIATDGGKQPKSSSTTLTVNLLDISDSAPTCVETTLSQSVRETLLSGDEVILFQLFFHTSVKCN